MTYDPNLRAKIVKTWNSGVSIPSEMGTPRADQMQGTENEQICELSGRVCYDSMGAEKSRPSAGPEGYHAHIGMVKHFSTIEHANFTVLIDMRGAKDSKTREWVMMALYNRPQLLVNGTPFDDSLRITLNLRHVIEWDKQTAWSDCCESPEMKLNADTLGLEIRNAIAPLAPMIVSAPGTFVSFENLNVRVVEPISESERFVSCFLAGGRGFSHEMVRHRFAISQRSSRFCDEGESHIIEHPLLTEFLADEKVPEGERLALHDERAHLHNEASTLYKDGVGKLQAWLQGRGVKAVDARKQARGTMRNDLGNGLYTELIFTANLKMWRHMFSMRSSAFADAEIREVFCRLLPEFKKHGIFTEFDMAPAPDGLGHCVKM